MRRLTWRDLISGTIGLGTLIAIFIVILSLSGSVRAYQQQDAVQNALITQQESTITKLRNQLLKLGETPVADAPSQKEIDKAVVGPQGPAGEPGLNATSDQIADAVADYCSAHGGCIGRSGQNGHDGNDGSAGAVGPNGTNGADGQVGPAGPQGPAGPAGANGLNGAAGAPGADGATWTPSVTCVAGPSILGPNILRFTWTNSSTGDQTTSDVSANCTP